MSTDFLFQKWPYAAMILLASGMAARYLAIQEPTNAERHRALDPPDLFSRTGLLQINVILLLLGHLVGFLFPQQILRWNSIPFRLYTLEIYAFGLGVWALVWWALLTWRRLRRSDLPTRRQAADAVFLSLLFTTLLSGSLTAILFRWGSSWGVITLTPYVVSLLHGRPAVELVAGLPFLVRLHVFSAFATLAVFPVTRLARVLLVAISRGFRWVSSPVQVIAYSASKVAEVVVQRLSAAIWVWPEDD